MIDFQSPFLKGDFSSPTGEGRLDLQCLDGMVENELRIIVLGILHLRSGSAGHGPANIGEVCGIHVSYPINGGSRSNPRRSSSDVSIRWETPTLTT